jgi:glyoxalase-like protein
MSGPVVDHLLVATTDLDAAAAAAGRLGLPVSAGGRHPGWGTANRIVPLGEAYLELIAVVAPAETPASPFGRWVAASRPGPMGWAVRVEDIDATATRLGLDLVPGSRAAPDGRRLRWRTAGVERAAAEPSLPFFIAWEPGAPFPGEGGAGLEVERIELRGDAGRLAEWIGEADLPVVVRPGPPAVERFVLRGPGGAIAVDAETLV